MLSKMTREEINLAVHKIAPDRKPDDLKLFEAAMYVASLFVGTDADTISGFMQEKRACVRRLATVFRSEGLWQGHKITGPQLSDPDFWGKIQVQFALTGSLYEPKKQAAS